MGVGASIFLIVVGLILALAVHVSIAGVDVQLVGWILVAAGVLGLIFTYALFAPRRRRTQVVERSGYDPGVRYDERYDDQGRVIRERTIDEGPL
jgi:hypothetical protein